MIRRHCHLSRTKSWHTLYISFIAEAFFFLPGQKRHFGSHIGLDTYVIWWRPKNFAPSDMIVYYQSRYYMKVAWSVGGMSLLKSPPPPHFRLLCISIFIPVVASRSGTLDMTLDPKGLTTAVSLLFPSHSSSRKHGGWNTRKKKTSSKISSRYNVQDPPDF